MLFGSKLMSKSKDITPHNVDADGNLAHDLGGFADRLTMFGIDRTIKIEDSPMKPYEERADAIMMLLSSPKLGIMNIHAMRRASEQFVHKEYLELSYYDRWLKGMASLCIEKGLFSQKEWDARIETLQIGAEKMLAQNVKTSVDKDE
ncbi:hypothetical protein SAR116_1732 [Candidatus Puniceispirillum marinum IMCC1322]|uniref:Nitrile hydratase beta subunit-like N-terminal domain-containing protein n=2 Tax=Candidatus Puniceispirillum TaxID=767891 RepID=D5BMD2_PUNMI|nr:hypothetical protein SAR116_1732 [Candidatus Puniceispirillum marinum IMCC1322]